MSNPTSMEQQAFETKRISLFEEHGFTSRAERFSDAQGRETYLLRGGEGPRTTVFVHGGIAEASVWALMAGHVEGALVLPDRPGCGLSYPIDYTGRDYQGEAAQWMRTVVDHLEVEQVDLVGNSMGGYFCMAFAVAYPERVRSLVLTGAPAGLDRELPPFIRLMATPGIGPLLSRMKMDDPQKLRDRVFSGLVAHPERIPDDALRVSMMNAAFPASQTCVHTMCRACATLLGGWRKHMLMRDAMANLPVRTLFLWGAQDAFAPPSSGQELADRMPDARVEIVEDAGHLPQLDVPKALAARINAFLADGESATAAAI